MFTIFGSVQENTGEYRRIQGNWWAGGNKGWKMVDGSWLMDEDRRVMRDGR
jgi:hypothetical protein